MNINSKYLECNIYIGRFVRGLIVNGADCKGTKFSRDEFTRGQNVRKQTVGVLDEHDKICKVRNKSLRHLLLLSFLANKEM